MMRQPIYRQASVRQWRHAINQRPMMPALLDTSFLLATAWIGDANHQTARAAMRELIGSRIVPAPVLPEMFYMVASRANYSSAIRLFETLRSPSFQIETLTQLDMARMQAIM